VELCEEKLPTYFIESEQKILSDTLIRHYDLHTRQELVTESFIPKKDKVTILLTCGASCPDAVVEGILTRVISFFPNAQPIEAVLQAVMAD